MAFIPVVFRTLGKSIIVLTFNFFWNLLLVPNGVFGSIKAPVSVPVGTLYEANGRSNL